MQARTIPSATALRAATTQSPAAAGATSPRSLSLSLSPPPRRCSAKLPPFRAGARPSRPTMSKNNTLALRSLAAAAASADAAAAAAAAAADAAAPSSPSDAPSSPSPSPASSAPSRGGPPPPRPGALPFDTPLAIALAGAAFEAYNSPAGFETVVDSKGRDAAALVDSDGTSTRYFDARVLAAATCGGAVASLRVSRAEGLPAADAWGASDPYFVAELAGRAAAHRSEVKPRTCSPKFDDEFELYVGRSGLKESGSGGKEPEEDPMDAVLKISLFDSDALTADDALGSAEISLRELARRSEAAGGDGDVELGLVAADGGAKGAGSVFLSGGVRTLSEAELAARASGSIAPDGTDEVARMSRAWRALARAAAGGEGDEGEEDASSIFAPAAFIENAASDTQLWVGIDGPSRRLMIAFRGTETTKILDVLTDLNATKAPLDARAGAGEPGALPLPPYARASPRPAAAGGPPLAPMDRDALWCHQGFLAAYRSVRCSVLRVVGECLAAASAAAEGEKGSSSSAPWTILLTGHSLGGALATLCAYELAHLELADAEGESGGGGGGGVDRLVVYNFGSPRVGSGAFASHFDASLPDAWRVVNAADLVPRVPRLMGYAHVGHAVPLRSDGTFDDEAIAENYAAGLYGDGDYLPVAPAESSAPAASPSPAAKPSFASPAASSSEEIEPVFDEEGANVITAATALAQAAASALFGGATRKREAEEAGAADGGAGGGASAGGYLTEKQAAADAVSKLVSSELRTMSDFLSGDAVSHHTEARYLEVLRKAVGAAGELARELAEEARGENAEGSGEVEAAAKKAAEAAQDLIEEAQK